jgi:hypothetical protein
MFSEISNGICSYMFVFPTAVRTYLYLVWGTNALGSMRISENKFWNNPTGVDALGGAFGHVQRVFVRKCWCYFYAFVSFIFIIEARAAWGSMRTQKKRESNVGGRCTFRRFRICPRVLCSVMFVLIDFRYLCIVWLRTVQRGADALCNVFGYIQR